MAWDDLVEHDGEMEGEVIITNGHVATGGVEEDRQGRLRHQNGLYDPQVVVVTSDPGSDMKYNIDCPDHNGLNSCTMTKSSINESDDEIRIKDVPFWSSCRVGLAILGFLGFINVYAVRVNLSVAIVCMVNQTYAHGDDTGVITDTECSDTRNGTSTSKPHTLEGTFNWDKTLQGTILGSFFWGYLVPQIPAGWLAIKFGGKRVFGIAMILASITTLFTPLLANTHYIALIVLRILLGCFTGVAFPSMHAMWGQWAPPLERSKLLAFTYAGTQVGIVVTFPVSGFLCKYGFAGGWPSIFYITGGVALLWSCVWMFMVNDSPRTHKSISDIERDYILQSLKQGSVENRKNIKVPWKSILTSLPVYAIIVANVSSDWGAYTLLTNIPTYINSVLKFDITSNGMVSALPYIAFWFVINIGGFLADYLRKRNLLSTAATRKVFTSFGKVVPAVMLVALGYVDCSQPALAIGLLTFAVSLTGAQYSGFYINHVEIAPELAGILFGLSNSAASITGFLSSLIVGVVTENDPTRTGWQIVFYIAAGIYVLGAIVFTVFSSGELQPWAQTECKQQQDLECRMETLEDADSADDGPAGEGMKMIDQTKAIV